MHSRVYVLGFLLWPCSFVKSDMLKQSLLLPLSGIGRRARLVNIHAACSLLNVLTQLMRPSLLSWARAQATHKHVGLCMLCMLAVLQMCHPVAASADVNALGQHSVPWWLHYYSNSS